GDGEPNRKFLHYKQGFSCNCRANLGFNRVIQNTRHSPTSQPLLAISELVMPTSPEPRLEHGIQHTSSWSLSGKTQFGRWAVKDFGPRVLRRIRMVFTRRLEGFDWKEVAANLHVSEPTCQDGFWREIRRRALSLEGRVDRQ